MGMSRVLAAVDDSPIADAVRRTAHTVATAVGAEVEEVSVVPDASVDGRDVDLVCGALATDGVIAGVLGARRLRGRHGPLGHVALAAVTRANVPLIVLPPDAAPLRTPPVRLLAPLDGTPATERAIWAVVRDLVGALGDLVVLHVFDERSVPMFVTSDEDRRILAEEWSHEHGVVSSEPVVLRLGRPAETVLEVVRELGPDGLVLGWHRRFDDGRAEVVRRALSEAGVPIVLVPVNGEPDTSGDDAHGERRRVTTETEGSR